MKFAASTFNDIPNFNYIYYTNQIYDDDEHLELKKATCGDYSEYYYHGVPETYINRFTANHHFCAYNTALIIRYAEEYEL